MEPFRVYDSIDSTNTEAARLLTQKMPLHGTAILAKHQTDGKGQQGRTWESQPGAHLAMSIILQPEQMMVSELPLLSMQVSLAIVKTLRALDISIDPLIKWPNDIYAQQKKLAGILIENALNASRVQHCIIGIGMNVNEKDFSEKAPNAISLLQITAKSFDIPHIASLIRNEVLEMLNLPLDIWKKEYDQFIYGLEAKHDFEKEGQVISRKVSGVNVDGKLLLTDDDGKTTSSNTHELKWLIR